MAFASKSYQIEFQHTCTISVQELYRIVLSEFSDGHLDDMDEQDVQRVEDLLLKEGTGAPAESAAAPQPSTSGTQADT